MGSFATVAAGAIMKASDVNQLCNALNGSTAVGLLVTGASTNTNIPYTLQIPTSVTLPDLLYQGFVNGDSWGRIGLLVDSSGYGSIWAGNGTSGTGWAVGWVGAASGFTTAQGFSVSGNYTSGGAATCTNGLSVTGAATVTGTLTGTTINKDAATLASGGTWKQANGVGITFNDATGTVQVVTSRDNSNNARGFRLFGTDTSLATHLGLTMGVSNAMTFSGQVAFSQYGGTITALTGSSFTAAGNPTTVTHGLGTTPTQVIITTVMGDDTFSTTAASSFGSTTFSANTFGSTKVHHWVAMKM